MNKEFSINITKPKAGKAVMVITGFISDESNNGAQFEQHINDLAEEAEEIEVQVINCYGGSIYQGMIIHDAIKSCSSRTTTLTKGISASMGVPISLAGNHKVLMADNSRLMMHRATIGISGDSDQLRKEADNLDDIEDKMSEIISKRCGKEKQWVKDNWFNKGDTYLSAKEAKKAKLIDEVVDMGIQKDAPKNILKDPNAVAKFYEEQIQSKPDNSHKSKTMKDLALMESALKVANPEFKAADENAVVAEITAQANKLKTAEAKVKELEQEVQKASDDKAEALVDAAIDANKIPKAQKEHWLGMAKSNYDGAKAVLDTMKPYQPASSRAGDPTEDKFADWDFEKFRRENPSALARIKENDPDRYEQLKKEWKESLDNQ